MSSRKHAIGRSPASSLAVPVVVLWICTASTLLGQPAPAYLQKTRAFHTSEQFQAITSGKVRLQRNVDAGVEADLRRLPFGLPIQEFTVTAIESATVTWIGTPAGAMRITAGSQSVEYL